MIFIACYSPCLIQRSYKQDGSKDFKYLGKADSLNISSNFDHDAKYRNWFQSNYILVPCGNCIGCRLDYSATWADRLLVESFDKPAFFLTLTYNDYNIPLSFNSGFETIDSDHISKFIVDLRNKFRNKPFSIRYAVASEYGGKQLRPHCHFIIYGLEELDLKLQFYKLNGLGQPMYTSDIINDLWPYGFNCVASASYESMAYTARYILKKQKGQSAAEYEAFDIEPPNFRMSRRPGIGFDWFEENYRELYENGYIPVSRSIKSNGKIFPNRYFNKLLKEKDPSLLSHYNAKVKQRSFDHFYDKLDNSSMTLDTINEFYEFERDNFLKKSDFSRDSFY